MRIAIVGGSGYLGAVIAQRCQERGHDVTILSRTRGPGPWTHVACDVTAPGLGNPGAREAISSADVCVLTVGSVAWKSTSSQALQVHDRGIGAVLALIESASVPPRVVHVSSILALGETTAPVSSTELYVGQRFRNWYEYGKYVAEHRVRNSRTRHSIVRFGPLLGLGYKDALPALEHGMAALLPMVLAGYPIPLTRGGRFPSYVGDVAAAGDIVADRIDSDADGETVTWFDPNNLTLLEVLTRVSLVFGRYPRVLDADTGRTSWLLRTGLRRIGIDPNLTDYAQPWIDLTVDKCVAGVAGRDRFIENMSTKLAHGGRVPA